MDEWKAVNEGDLADKIGHAAGQSRVAAGFSPSYSIADQVDQMIILYEILKELRKLNERVKDSGFKYGDY